MVLPTQMLEILEAKMSKCYITNEECEFFEDDECLAVFIEQCPIEGGEEKK